MKALQKTQLHGRRRCLAWMLACALMLVAQSVSILHELDADSQAPDHACEICLVAAGADAAIDAQPAAFAPTSGSAESSQYVHAIQVETPELHPPSRGPPTAS